MLKLQNRWVLSVSSAVLAIALVSCEAPGSMEGLRIPQDPAVVERGQYLATSLAACGFCHGNTATPEAPLSGGRSFPDLFGSADAPNITPAKTGIGNWSPLDLMHAVRESVRPESEKFSPVYHQGFDWLSDNDALALAAYLKAVPPVEHEVEKRTLTSFDRSTTGLLAYWPSSVGYVPDINPRFQSEYGEYLVEHVARCISCHNSPETIVTPSEYLGGGAEIKTPAGTKVAPGITSDEKEGIGSWSEDALVHYLKTGKTPFGDQRDPNFCPVSFYSRATDRDLRLIAKYIKKPATAVAKK